MAQDRLGRFYINGLGVETDLGKAYELLSLAAEQGNPNARANLNLIYEMSFGGGDHAEEALQITRTAAEAGDSAAQDLLRWMYYDGKGVAQDREQAAKWTRLAAEGGDAGAQFNLGYIYANGDGVEKNPEEAGKWYRTAGDNGDARGYYNLAFMYEEGRGVAKDPVQATDLFRQAAKMGHADAQDTYGIKLLESDGIEKDRVEALVWFGIASANGAEHGASNRRFLGVKMSPSEIEEARARARERVAELPSAWRDFADEDTPTRVQRALTELAYAPGPIDGDIGQGTVKAIRAFQEDRGLSQTGEIDEELLSALGLQKD